MSLTGNSFLYSSHRNCPYQFIRTIACSIDMSSMPKTLTISKFEIFFINLNNDNGSIEF